ncbi:hypothetical protein, conserved [Trypanosoma cruzi]|uniref:Uncharacterized protein n=2 Tax=Trypanosoma cruzi TaxID=5693 RepID=Q4E079_TRYCC|nr:hypothetical protein, conserved [Trypanosoma cruzi]EAN98200.1 hypothetical protein, conserved [Trypanosoma cruzi]|eukprot:XP_820051.1 hypothetical protein [Trypanosoma cruzi strain CL Brener]
MLCVRALLFFDASSSVFSFFFFFSVWRSLLLLLGLMCRADGKQVVKRNLVVAVLALVFSFVAVDLYLASEDVRLSAEPAPRVSELARSSGVRLAMLPSPLNEVTLLVAKPFGAADVSHKLARFFTKNVKPAASEENTRALNFRSESEIMKELLSSASANMGDEAKVLHLCSANSCVGPYLSQLHAKRAKQSLGRLIKVYALVYGDFFVGRGVENDLQNLGVLISTVDYPSKAESAMPLIGVIDEKKPNIAADAICSVIENSCQYRIWDKGTQPQIPVSLIPFSSVSFGNSPLLRTRFDVVHIDVNWDEALASICFLRGVLSSSFRPSHIYLAVYASPLLEDTLLLVNTLREQAHYHVFLAGGRCMAAHGASDVLSHEKLSKLLRFESPQLPSKLNSRGYAMEPLCMLFLSQSLESLPQLLQRVMPIDGAHAMANFIFEFSSGSGPVVTDSESIGVWSALNYLMLAVPFVVAGLLIWSFVRGQCRLRTVGSNAQ